MKHLPFFPCAGARALHAPTRRGFLYSLGASLGSVAFTSLLGEETNKNPLAPKDGHLPAKAKNVIFLMMEGGPAHIDTFDPKLMLAKVHLNEFVREDKQASAMQGGKRYYVQRPLRFAKHGHSSADMAENWTHLAKVADDFASSVSEHFGGLA